METALKEARLPVSMFDPNAAERERNIQDMNHLSQALGSHMWGREAHDYGVPEQNQGGVRSGALQLPEHVPILPTPSSSGTPQSSGAATPPDGANMLGAHLSLPQWGLGNLHQADPALKASASQFQVDGNLTITPPVSAAALTQPGWKPAVSSKPKSLAEIQQEEAARAKADEKAASATSSRSTPALVATSSGGFGPWAAPSPPQAKSLREIQEEEARRAASLSLQAKASVFPNVPSSRAGDPPSWGAPSVTEKTSSLYEVGDELLESQSSAKTSDLEASTVSSAVPNQSTQAPAPNTPAFDDGDFIEPKESKKNKKRAAKAKGTPPAGKAPMSELPPVVLTPTSGKNAASRLAESAEETLPAPPPGPSLADFLTIREEPVASSQPLPAWSMVPNRQAKSAKSLKEIQEAEKRAREEERQNQMLQAAAIQQQAPAPLAKPSITLMTRSGSGGASAWQRPASQATASKPATPSQQVNLAHTANNSGTSIPRSKVGVFKDDDDLFWDYGQDTKLNIGAVKQATKPEP